MKILLTAINAKYIHSNLAVYSLRAYARQYQEHVRLAEYTINHRLDFILQEIYKQRPDVLCFSCYIWNISYVSRLIRELHKLLPQLPIWLGGPEVSFECEAFLREHPMVTGIMRGEGEKTFAQLCEYYVKAGEAQDRKGFREIPGLVYRDGEKILFTPEREPLSMDELPFCYDQLADFENRIIYYETSRGCPFRCSYCLSSLEKHLRFRSLKLVEKELQFFLDHQVAQVKFVDRTFNCNHAHAMAIWRYIREHDNGVTNFHFEVSADLLNREELELIRTMRPGLIQLEIGVQSTNPDTVHEIHRTMDLHRLKEVVREIRSFGNVHQHLDLIAGLPLEGYDSFRRSFDEIYGLHAQQLQLGFLKVLKGSYLYENRERYRVLYHSEAPYEVLSTDWMTYEELLAIKMVEEMLEVYYNSGQYQITMCLLELEYDSPFLMFQRMGEFYEKRNLFYQNHSRMRRSEILLDFLEEEERAGHHMDLPMYREALIFDLYHRENMKSRPRWALDLSEWKEAGKKLALKGKNVHAEPFFYDFLPLLTQEKKKKPERRNRWEFVLFSYEERSAWDGQAAVKGIERPMGEGEK